MDPNISVPQIVQYTFRVLSGELPLDNQDPAVKLPRADENVQAYMMVLLQMVVCLAVVYYLIGSVLEQVVKLFGLKSPEVQNRFVEVCEEAIHYTISVVVMVMLFYNESWFWPSGYTQTLFHTAPARAANPSYDAATGKLMTPEYLFVYFFEAAFYIQGAVKLLVRPKRKDFYQMFAHHTITIILIVGSFFKGELVSGINVMIVHNLSDPFLQYAKLIAYTNRWKGLCDLSFVTFASIFAVTRLCVLPYLWYVGFYSWIDPADLDELALEVLLALLFPIHCFWFVLICKMIVNSIMGKDIADQGDIREEGEKQWKDKDKNKNKEQSKKDQ